MNTGKGNKPNLVLVDGGSNPPLAPNLKLQVMKMQACQIIMLAIMFINLLVAANAHGKPKEGRVDFWSILIGQIILFSLLMFGGFFNY